MRLHRKFLSAQTRDVALGETDDVRLAGRRFPNEPLHPGHGGMDRARDGWGGERYS